MPETYFGYGKDNNISLLPRDFLGENNRVNEPPPARLQPQLLVEIIADKGMRSAPPVDSFVVVTVIAVTIC